MASTPSRVTMVAITACVVAAGVGAGMFLQPKDRPVPAAMDPNVSIDVVAPRAPEPESGGVMEVGDLADRYRHPAQPVDHYPPAYADSEDHPPANVEPRRVERPREAAPERLPPPVMAERRERPSGWPFGLDQPRPDAAADRRERMARLDDERRFDEARVGERFDDRGYDRAPRGDRGREAEPDRDRGGRERQWYRSDGSRTSGPEARE